MNYHCQNVAPLTVAALTILAMFLAPLCGILCGAPTHCASPSAIRHVDAEDCHHIEISADGSAANLSVAGATKCAQAETVAILLDAAKKHQPQAGLLSAAQSAATTATNGTSFDHGAGNAQTASQAMASASNADMRNSSPTGSTNRSGNGDFQTMPMDGSRFRQTKYSNIQIEDGLACEWGEHASQFKITPEAPPVSWHGTGFHVLKRQSDGSWKFAVMILNQ